MCLLSVHDVVFVPLYQKDLLAGNSVVGSDMTSVGELPRDWASSDGWLDRHPQFDRDDAEQLQPPLGPWALCLSLFGLLKFTTDIRGRR